MRILSLLSNVFFICLTVNSNATSIIGRSSIKIFSPFQNLLVDRQVPLLFKCKQTNNEILIKDDPFLNDKQIITIAPGGYLGFYVMGICSYIKENYDLSNYIFTGASAGSWNALFMTFLGDPIELVLTILDTNVLHAKNIYDVEQKIKFNILDKFSESDFDLKRLFIGVTTIQNLHAEMNILTNFSSLEDALDCCIASSHIPFITGGAINKYHNIFTFDGGFSKYPYLNTKKPALHISPSIWTPVNLKVNTLKDIYDYIHMFTKGNFDLIKLYDKGFINTKKNKLFLDSIFIKM